MSAEDVAKSKARAAQDLMDIADLRKSDPFVRYFQRRLTQRRTETIVRFLNDPPDKCDKDEREVLRRLLLAYDDLLGLLDSDEAAARSVLR